MGCLHDTTSVAQSTEISEIEQQLAELKRQNFFGQKFENMLKDYYANDNDVSASHELAMRTLYLAVQSGRLIPQGSA